MGKLDGKVAVVTGGNSGIALAAAKRFVEDGAFVFVTGRRQEELDAAVRQIRRSVQAIRGDVSSSRISSASNGCGRLRSVRRQPTTMRIVRA